METVRERSEGMSERMRGKDYGSCVVLYTYLVTLSCLTRVLRMSVRDYGKFFFLGLQ